MKYYKDKKVKEKIDDLLRRNSSIIANFGTGSKYDVRTKANRDKEVKRLMKEIKLLDEVFYNVVKNQDEK